MSKPRMRVLLDDSNIEPYQWGNSDKGASELSAAFFLYLISCINASRKKSDPTQQIVQVDVEHRFLTKVDRPWRI